MYSLTARAPSSTLICLNSRDAQDYYEYSQYNPEVPLKTHFTYSFDVGYAIDEDRFDTLISLQAASIPNTWYNVRLGKNFLVVRIGDASGVAKSFLIELLPANYTAVELIVTVQNKVQTLLDDPANWETDAPGSTVVKFEYNPTRMKFLFMFTTQTVGPCFIEFSWDDSAEALAANNLIPPEMLGFLPKSSNWVRYTLTDVGDFVDATNESGLPPRPDIIQVENSLESTRCVVMSKMEYLFVQTNITPQCCLDTRTGNYTSTIAAIPVDCPYGSMLIYRPRDGAQFKLRDQIGHIQSITIQILADDGALLDTHGADLEIILCIDHILREQEPLQLSKFNRRPFPPKALTPEEKNINDNINTENARSTKRDTNGTKGAREDGGAGSPPRSSKTRKRRKARRQKGNRRRDSTREGYGPTIR